MTSTVEHRTRRFGPISTNRRRDIARRITQKDGVDAVAKLDLAKVQPTKRTPGAFKPPSLFVPLNPVPA